MVVRSWTAPELDPSLISGWESPVLGPGRTTVGPGSGEVQSPGPQPDETDGDDRDRTDGLRLARAALSQLSYIPLAQPTPAPNSRDGNGPG